MDIYSDNLIGELVKTNLDQIKKDDEHTAKVLSLKN